MDASTGALPIPSANLAEHYKDVQSFQRARARVAQRSSKLLAVVAGLAIVANLGQAWTIASLLPLTKLVPVYLWIKPDGSVDNSVTLSRLPVTQGEAVIATALWEYVRLREGYSRDSAQYSYDVVSAMSDLTVRGEFQKWFNYPNPASPQVTVGQKGQIDIEHISSARIAPNVEQIRFRRARTIYGEPAVVTTWTATLQYRIVTALPAAARLSNPGGIIITAYQAAEDGGQ